MSYFSKDEIQCNCGCGANNISDEYLSMLTDARIIAGIPFAMSSMCRCPERNASEGGKPTSSHISTEDIECKAGDIKCTSSRNRSIIVAALIEAGFTRIGIGDDFIHADCDRTKAQDVMWLY